MTLVRPIEKSIGKYSIHGLWLKWRGSEQGWSFWGSDDEWHHLGEMCPKKIQKGV